MINALFSNRNFIPAVILASSIDATIHMKRIGAVKTFLKDSKKKRNKNILSSPGKHPRPEYI